MNLFRLEKRWDSYSGHLISPEVVRDHMWALCDYTLEKIDLHDARTKPAYMIQFDFNHDSEPVWYEDYYRINRELNVQIEYSSFSEFMEGPWHFANTEEYGAADQSWFLFSAWVANRRSQDPAARFANCATIEQVMSKLRQDNLRKIMKDKLFTIEELGLKLE